MDDEIHKLSLAVRKEAMALMSEDKDLIIALVRYAATRAGYELPYPFLDIVAAHFVQDLLELSKTMDFEREDLTPLTIKAKVKSIGGSNGQTSQGARKATSETKKETAVIEESEVDSVLRTFVRVAESKWKIELGEAGLRLLLAILVEDLGENRLML